MTRNKVLTAVGALGAMGAVVLGAGGLLSASASPSAHGRRPATTVATNPGAKCQTGMPTVTVQGYGSAEGTPDQAVLSLGVQTQAVTALAAMDANAITFGMQDESALLGQARAAAVEQAANQAQVMAQAAGMALGPLCSLQDNTSLPQPPETFSAVGLPAAAHSVAATPIEAGSEQVTANVTAVYQLGTSGAAAGAGASS